jgi:sulfite exporter TauE/SafE
VIAALVPAFVMGLAGGAHCVAMCGGVASAVCGTACARGTLERARDSLAYNAGRIATYAAFGALAGAIGAVPSSFVPLEVMRLALRLLAAVFLFGLGLHLAGVTRFFGRIEKVGQPLWSRIAPLARRLLPVRSPLHAALLGAAWGFVPCGLVYSGVALSLASGSALAGGATMLAFGLGTLPVMTIVTTMLGDVARRLATGPGRRLAGAVVLVLAAQQAYVVLGTVDIHDAMALGTDPNRHLTCHPH